ncbi:hypothetical protein [Nocardia brasiliensis]|uniref:hypothetical protein n=1 Tax=Nocardia brasiliensis TaxID=37326 RepID=UPI003D9301B8
MMTIAQAIQLLANHDIPNPTHAVRLIVWAQHGCAGIYTDQPLEALNPAALHAAINGDQPASRTLRPPPTTRRTHPVYTRDEPHTFTIPLTVHQYRTFEVLYELCGVLPIAELTRAGVTFYRDAAEVANRIKTIRSRARQDSDGDGRDRIYQRLRWIHKAVSAAVRRQAAP